MQSTHVVMSLSFTHIHAPLLAPPRSHRRVSYFYLRHAPPSLISQLSLHDALPLWSSRGSLPTIACTSVSACRSTRTATRSRSEEHTSELQARRELVCRLLREKKKLIAG